MRGAAAFFPIVLALGAMSLAPRASAQAQDAREEGPREIDKCQTISNPGSYKLVNNLTFTGTTGVCLSITADFVTIDLAGFTMTGIGIPIPTSAIVATPPSGQVLDGIAVRNGSISGFLVGVDLSSANGSIVEGLRVVGGVLASEGSGIRANGVVKGNTASGSGVGIAANGVVTGNFATGNLGGISVGAGSTVIGNVANGNQRTGFGVVCPSNVTDNTALGNPFNLVLDGDGCHSEDNVAP